MKGISMFAQIAKLIGYLLIAFVLFHWLTAGHDNIIEGPPECLDGSSQIVCPADE